MIYTLGVVLAARIGNTKVGVHLINLGEDVEYARKYLEQKVGSCTKDIKEFEDKNEVVPAWTEKNYIRATRYRSNLKTIIDAHKVDSIVNQSTIKI